MKTATEKKKLEKKLLEIEKKEDKAQKIKDKQRLEKLKVSYAKKYAGRFFEVRNIWKLHDLDIEFRRDRDSTEKVKLYIQLLPNLQDEWRAPVRLYLFSRKTFCSRDCEVSDIKNVQKEITERVAMPYPTEEELGKILTENKRAKPGTDHEFVKWLWQNNNIEKYRESFIVREVEKSFIEEKIKAAVKRIV